MLSRIVKKEGLEKFLPVYRARAVTLKAQLGAGGFACVYKGTLTVSSDVGDRSVAVKVAHPDIKDTDLASFFREARAALTVTGVHVCQPLGVTVCDGRAAFILPLYEANAHNLVDEEYPSGLPLWLVLSVIRRVAQGILDMHTKGFIHLDLKPANILVNGDDFKEVVVADFGLSTTYT